MKLIKGNLNQHLTFGSEFRAWIMYLATAKYETTLTRSKNKKRPIHFYMPTHKTE